MKEIIASFDIFKFLLAIMIVGVHTEVFVNEPFMYKWGGTLFNMAVPEFFLISSFLFIRGKNNVISFINLKHFLGRLGKLYFFWFVLTIPISIYNHPGWLILPKGLLHFVKDVFLGSSFHGSWFFSALAVGVSAVWGISKVQKIKFVWLLPLIINLIIHGQTYLDEDENKTKTCSIIIFYLEISSLQMQHLRK